MKVAICFSGQVRSLDLCADSIQKTIIDKSSEKVDIFCHFYYSNPNDEEKMKRILNPVDYKFENDPSLEPSFLNTCYDNRCRGKGPATLERTRRVLNQIYSVFMANELKKKTEKTKNFKYDVVFRMRPDQIYEQQLEDLELVKKNELFVPAHDWHGGINDRFSFATSETMDKYASMWLELEQLMQMGRFHPETLAMNICKKHNIKVVKSKITCKRVREDGTIIGLNW